MLSQKIGCLITGGYDGKLKFLNPEDDFTCVHTMEFTWTDSRVLYFLSEEEIICGIYYPEG
jgi:hypothetical protein